RKRWSERQRSHPKPSNAPRDWRRYNPPAEASRVLAECPKLFIASTSQELVDSACGNAQTNYFEVGYEVEGKGHVVEATAARVRNGICANYTEPYMRRRDPNCIFIADDKPTDKPTFREEFKQEF